MRLVLLRHGIAIDRQDPRCPAEEDRYLTGPGIERTRRAAAGLARLGLRPDRVLSSPWLRALETARIAAGALDFRPEAIEITAALLPLAPPSELLREIESPRSREVLVCGHAPHLDEVLAELVGIRSTGGARLRKAGAASIEFISAAPGRGTLEWLIPPRVLRELGDA